MAPDGPLATQLCIVLTPWLSPSDTCKSMHSWAGEALTSPHAVSESKTMTASLNRAHFHPPPLCQDAGTNFP